MTEKKFFRLSAFVWRPLAPMPPSGGSRREWAPILHTHAVSDMLQRRSMTNLRHRCCTSRRRTLPTATAYSSQDVRRAPDTWPEFCSSLEYDQCLHCCVCDGLDTHYAARPCTDCSRLGVIDQLNVQTEITLDAARPIGLRCCHRHLHRQSPTPSCIQDSIQTQLTRARTFY